MVITKAALSLAATAIACTFGRSKAQGSIPTLVSKLRSLRDALAAIEVDYSREESTLFTAEYFEEAITLDNSSISLLEGIYADFFNCGTNATCINATAVQAAQMPLMEVSETEEMMRDAIASATAALECGGSCRLPSPLVNATQIVDNRGYFRDPATGAPVFTGGFNMMDNNYIQNATYAYRYGTQDFNVSPGSWLAANMTVPASLLAELRAALDVAASQGYKIEVFLDHSDMPSWANDAYPGFNNDSTTYNKFINYDIDHPGYPASYGALLGQVAASIAGHPALASYMLCNEPYFYAANSSWSLSSYVSFLNGTYNGNISALNEGWLTNYTSFEAIPWDAQFTHSNWWSTPLPQRYDWAEWNRVRVVQWATTMRNALIGADPNARSHIKVIDEMWAWFTQPHRDGLDREKLLDVLEINGCDSSINDPPVNSGGDHGACPTNLVSAYNYSLTWLDTAMSYDLQKSVASGPGKALVDSEWHADSTATTVLKAQHIYAAYWLAVLSGQAAQQQWYWGRVTGQGPPNKSNGQWTWIWFPYSIMTQPQLVNAFARGLIDVNAIAPLIPPLVMGNYTCSNAAPSQESSLGAVGSHTAASSSSSPTPPALQPCTNLTAPLRPVLILYSEAAATQDTVFLCTEIVAYEAAAFLGVSIGFITDTTLSKPGGCAAFTSAASAAALEHGQAILVPSTSFISDATFDCLQTVASTTSVNMVIIGNETSANGTSLRYNERGVARATAAMAWVDQLPHLAPSTGPDMFRQLEQALINPAATEVASSTLPSSAAASHALAAAAPAALVRELQCVNPANTSATLFGVWCRYVRAGADGLPAHDGSLPSHLLPPALPLPASGAYSHTLFIINLSNSSTQLSLMRYAGSSVTNGSASASAPITSAHDVMRNSTITLGSGPDALQLNPLDVRVLLIPL